MAGAGVSWSLDFGVSYTQQVLEDDYVVQLLHNETKQPIPYGCLPSTDLYAKHCNNPGYFHHLTNLLPSEFEELYTDIASHLPYRHDCKTIDSRTMVMTALHFLKSGCTVADLVHVCGTSKSTVQRLLWPTIEALRAGTASDIQWPNVEQRRAMQGKLWDWSVVYCGQLLLLHCCNPSV
jgi:hypothetical protein